MELCVASRVFLFTLLLLWCIMLWTLKLCWWLFTIWLENIFLIWMIVILIVGVFVMMMKWLCVLLNLAMNCIWTCDFTCYTLTSDIFVMLIMIQLVLVMMCLLFEVLVREWCSIARSRVPYYVAISSHSVFVFDINIYIAWNWFDVGCRYQAVTLFAFSGLSMPYNPNGYDVQSRVDKKVPHPSLSPRPCVVCLQPRYHFCIIPFLVIYFYLFY